MSSEKHLLSQTNIVSLILEERKNVSTMSVDTFKKRKAEYIRQRSLALYHLIRGDVIKAFAHAQAGLDIRKLKNPNSGCRLSDGRDIFFAYESNEDRDIRLALTEAAKEDQYVSAGEHAVMETLARMNSDKEREDEDVHSLAKKGEEQLHYEAFIDNQSRMTTDAGS